MYKQPNWYQAISGDKVAHHVTNTLLQMSNIQRSNSLGLLSTSNTHAGKTNQSNMIWTTLCPVNNDIVNKHSGDYIYAWDCGCKVLYWFRQVYTQKNTRSQKHCSLLIKYNPHVLLVKHPNIQYHQFSLSVQSPSLCNFPIFYSPVMLWSD